MPTAASNGGRYEVLCSAAIAQQIRHLQERASAQGRGAQFLRALRSIVRHLTYDPKSFGEPLYRLPALRTDVRIGVVLPLSIDFAVSEERHVVFIKSIKLFRVP
jgi:hypothetical protein